MGNNLLRSRQDFNEILLPFRKEDSFSIKSCKAFKVNIACILSTKTDKEGNPFFFQRSQVNFLPFFSLLSLYPDIPIKGRKLQFPVEPP